jgi:AcrR family transcriptional regulator
MAEVLVSKGGRTRQSVLEAAYQLFLEQGYAATSMRQIAQKAGLALGGIYNHFASKEAIFAELVVDRHPFQQVLPVLLNTPAGGLESFVRSAAQTLVSELGRRPDFMKLMFIELVEFKGRNMPDILERMLPEAVPLISKLNQDNNVLRPMPPIIFFRAFLGLFISYYMTELLLANTPAARQQLNALDHFVEIFLHGVMLPQE